ncbi:MAG: threonine ammonia-lyase [Bryobacteraceae bacterium]
MVTLESIRAARERIRSQIYETPCAYSETLSQLAGNPLLLKLENLQMTGSFKERGALNKILTLSEAERAHGVIAASAGNHAQAVAYHATRNGIRAQICMPLSTPLVKVTQTRAYGGDVVLFGDSYDEAYQEACRRQVEHGFTFVHAFNDDAVISGQGTIGLELLEQCPDLEAIVCPIGGGGLLGGIACAVKELKPAVRIVGVQTQRIPSMIRACAEGKPVTLPAASTIAEGIAVRRAGDLTLPLIERYVDEMVTVDEEDIANAILLLLEREKTLAEGAGAASTAALLQKKTTLRGKRTVSIVCGGNIDVTVLSRIIERGLVKDGRLVRLHVYITDRPGGLKGLVEIVAAQRCNIVDLRHERAYFGVHLGETVVDITLETRGPGHIAEVTQNLETAGYLYQRVI